MDNKKIFKILKQTALLMELHEENDFKVRSYQSAVNNLRGFSEELKSFDEKELTKIDGVGKSIAQAIHEISSTGELQYYNELLNKTPEGVREMLELKGFGPKKIRTLWKDLSVENLEKLLVACEEGKVAALKGFGAKTQQKMYAAVKFKINNRYFLHYREAEKLGKKIVEELKELEGVSRVDFTGASRRRMEVIKPVEVIAATSKKTAILKYVQKHENFELNKKESGPFSVKFKVKDPATEVTVYLTNEDNFVNEQFKTTGSLKHLNLEVKDGEKFSDIIKSQNFTSEEDIYKEAGWPFIEPELREGLWEKEWVENDNLPKLLEMNDLKGILHNHSTYSDGMNTLKEMADYCRELGYEYLGISDHSKSAGYAGGLHEEEVKKQHKEIESLNHEYENFKIFKGIESDILADGSLDYNDETLASFDFVVASIHSGLSMDEKKATDRLITAIANPFTTILGHPTGRLLLQRQAYPINHKAIIDACAHYDVVIEINAHPWRLDMDWRHVHYAIEKGVQISINPDAHEKAGYHDMYYGLLVGRKAGLTSKNTLNAMSLKEIRDFFQNRKKNALAKS